MKYLPEHKSEAVTPDKIYLPGELTPMDQQDMAQDSNYYHKNPQKLHLEKPIIDPEFKKSADEINNFIHQIISML